MYYILCTLPIQLLKTHIRTIDDLRHQVNPSDVPRFDRLTEGIRHEVQSAIAQYGMVRSRLADDVGLADSALSGSETSEYCYDKLGSVSDQSVLIPREEAAVQSWEELRTV